MDVADLIGAMAEDDDVRAIACLFEGVPERAAPAAKRASARASAGKPVIVYKLGVSEDGAAAARSHTGSMAGSAAAFRALFERAGFVAVDNYEALVEYAKFFAAAGKPLARGVAVVSGSGGAGIIAADMAARHGVPMPQPAEKTTAVLRSVVPEFGAARNPCDPTGQVLSVPESYNKCCQALLDDPQYGVLLCAMSVSSRETGAEARPRTSPRSRARSPSRSPWSGCRSGCRGQVPRPTRPTTGSASSAPWTAAMPPSPPGSAGMRDGRPRSRDFRRKISVCWFQARKSWAKEKQKQSSPNTAFSPRPERQAKNADEAVKAAAELGYPVVLKADGDIEHKTEAGAVKLDLRDEAALRAACAAMTAAKDGFLVQPMLKGGVELVVGVKRDPQVGPVLLVGLGGVLVEILRDTALALAPVGKAEARRMLESLKGYKLLQGYRGAPAADLDAVCEAIARISEFAADYADQVEEIDVNPLLARADGAVALDALIVLRDR